MRNKIFLSFLALLANVSFAQGWGTVEDSRTYIQKLEAAQKVAEYNGALAGYANICGGQHSDVLKIIKIVFENFKTIGLKDLDIANLNSTYQQAAQNTINKKSSVSQIECKLFMEEFNKIIYEINKGS